MSNKRPADDLPDIAAAFRKAVGRRGQGTHVRYGRCVTDFKSGKKLRPGWRGLDFFKDEPYAARVHAMLTQLGLPQPKKYQIFRGTHHDLLFLDSHGVVVRIGPLDMAAVLNPAMLQPLGAMVDQGTLAPVSKNSPEKAPLTVAIYPGLELAEHFNKKSKRPPLAGNLKNIFNATGQWSGDIKTSNTGIVRVLTQRGKRVATPVMIDVDSCNSAALRPTRARIADALRNHRQAVGIGQADTPALRRYVLKQAFHRKGLNLHAWHVAQEAHEPLRLLFAAAFGGCTVTQVQPDEQARRRFWAACAAVTNRPVAITVPSLRVKKNRDGDISYVPCALHVPHLVLYRPWTGRAADRAARPRKTRARC